MALTDDLYVISEEIKQNSRFGEGIYIYGTGMDGELFLLDIGTEINILGVIDTYKTGNVWHGYAVMSKDRCMDSFVKGKIIITCYNFRNEIVNGLNEMGLIGGVDYFVWDRLCSYKLDDFTKKFINWNKVNWTYDLDNKKCRVLIPMHYSIHDGGAIMYAYVSDYARNRFNAYVEAYIIHWKKDVCQTIRKVYESFGVKDVLNGDLTASQEKEAEEIFLDLWPSLNSYSDWKKIHIYGIHMGSVLIRTFLRLYAPCFDPRDPRMESFLKDCIKKVVYWHDRFDKYDYRMVFTWDGGAYDMIIANLAIAKGIPTYSMYFVSGRRLKMDDPWCGTHFRHYKTFFESLTQKEREYGVEWAKTELSKLFCGQGNLPFEMKDEFDAYKVGKTDYRITGDEKTKIVIVPHSFEDDSYMYGEHLFYDNYFSWLCHVGELSDKYQQYGWYLKLHPMSSERDRDIINLILKKYTRIKLLPEKVSVVQMKEEGIKWALTVQGSIGHEYPLIGIQVINAGENPHQAFGFNWNPKSIEEYDYIIQHIEELEPKKEIEEVYQFYCIDRLFYDYSKRFGEPFFENPELNKDDQILSFGNKMIRMGTWKYKLFLDEWTMDQHARLKERIKRNIESFDKWEDSIFYKNAILVDSDKKGCV